jgi:aspartate racemase
VKKLGIAGGMGPLASALFAAQIVRLTRAETDQDHIETVLYNAPFIPDRTAYITGRSDLNPLDGLFKVCRVLEIMSDIIALPCVTAHHFYDQFKPFVSVPIPDMHRVIAEGSEGVSKLGILATEGTVAGGRLQRILNEYGITPVLPLDQGSVTRLIYNVKKGRPPDTDAFLAESWALAARGAEKVLLACTDLTIYQHIGKAPPLLDASELLARRCITLCGGETA